MLIRGRLMFLLLPPLLCCTARSATPAAPATPATQRAPIAALVEPLIHQQICQAMVVGTIDGDGPHVWGFGRATDDAAAPPDGSTVFEIGSVSKTFTSLLLAIMCESGEVGLDDPIAKFLPPNLATSQPAVGRITLRQLATHTSGLPRMPDNISPRDWDNPYLDYTPDQLWSFLGSVRLRHPPGEKMAYSNVGVGLLGQILAHRAGQTYESLLIQRICRPLNLSDTRITLNDSMRRRLAIGHNANGYAVKNWDIPTFAGAGAIRSTTDDLLKYVAAQIDPPPALRAAILATHQERFRAGPNDAIGLAWLISRRDGVWWHNGGTGGYNSQVAFSPDRHVGVVVLCNTSGPWADGVGIRVMANLLGKKLPPIKIERPFAQHLSAAIDWLYHHPPTQPATRP